VAPVCSCRVSTDDFLVFGLGILLVYLSSSLSTKSPSLCSGFGWCGMLRCWKEFQCGLHSHCSIEIGSISSHWWDIFSVSGTWENQHSLCKNSPSSRWDCGWRCRQKTGQHYKLPYWALNEGSWHTTQYRQFPIVHVKVGFSWGFSSVTRISPISVKSFIKKEVNTKWPKKSEFIFFKWSDILITM
jgi:hypothetical protein